MLRRYLWQSLYVVVLLIAMAIGFMLVLFGLIHVQRLTGWAWLREERIAGLICLGLGSLPAGYLVYHFASKLDLPLDLGGRPAKGFPLDRTTDDQQGARGGDGK